MISITYALMVLAGLLIAAAAVVAIRERRAAFILLAAALACAIAGGILAYHKIESPVGPKSMARIRHAAARDPGTDAVTQWSLADNAISVTEYGAIRDTYLRDTGRDINQEPAK